MAQQIKRTRLAQVHLTDTADDSYSAPAGTGADMFLAREIVVTWDGGAGNDPEYHRADSLNMPRTEGIVYGSIAFQVPIKGSGTANVAPEYSKALQACGLAETITTDVRYRRETTHDGAGGNPAAAYSCSVLIDGVRYGISGAFGNLQINGANTTFGLFAFSLQGAFQMFADDALEAPTYETTVAPRFGAMAFSTNFGGVFGQAEGLKGVTSFQLNLNNALVMGEDVNADRGYYGARIVPGGRPSGSFDPELVLAGTKNWFQIAEDQTIGSITTGVVGATAGNRYQIDVHGCQLDQPERNVVNGIEKLTVPFAVAEEATASEGAASTDVEITFS